MITNDNQVKYSIIIPVYNTPEKPLIRCFDCFQTISGKFEIIAVDDGSNQSTADLLVQLASDNEHIKLLHESNKGVAAARNTGIANAKGEWITFCDADDEFDSRLFESVLREHDNCDFIYCAYRKKRSNNDIQVELNDCSSAGDMTGEILCQPNLYGTVWGKAYKTEFIKKNNLFFNTELTHAEDTEYLLRYLALNPKINYVDIPFYVYTVSGDSAAKKNSKAIEGFTQSLEQIYSLLVENQYKDIELFWNCCLTNLLIISANYVFNDQKTYKESKRDLLNVLDISLFNQCLSKYDRKRASLKINIAAFLLKHKFYGIYWLVFKFRKL